MSERAEAEHDERPAGGTSDAAPDELTVLFVTGMSGAGRSTAANVLEDDGWYVADNVPPSLISTMVGMVRESDPTITRLAMVLRASDPNLAHELEQLRDSLGQSGIRTRLLYLDASEEALVRRFEQVRRRHPLQGKETLVEGIARERAILAPIKNVADLVVETSGLTAAKLRSVVEGVAPGDTEPRLSIAVQSFGFKYGLPIDSDLVADVRFLPNPHWIDELRDHNGQEAPVRDYVLGQPDAGDFLDLYTGLVSIVGRGYLREGKRYMTISVGCTGGKHRSVAISEELAHRLRKAVDDAGAASYDVRVMHRDLGRE
ncbi:RNase adapter RapZ [Gordonia amicalis]|nr:MULTISPECIES: RNase adapter RapZ [Gordonia]KAF0968456.1 Nucleotide-binding protein [Gordonia sp. YY1]MBA5848532.1 RNase adapter RapZ [Gordonia amicalis]MDV7098608.1 RNase adapter RapZ [Gordonia amicalis]MDV7172304.1 RNase adapter RapZ [Gordonia amicalis]UOG22079.1 RNase adapter RapZ [Gordonia amicalis]